MKDAARFRLAAQRDAVISPCIAMAHDFLMLQHNFYIISLRRPAIRGEACPELCPVDRVQRRTGEAPALRQWPCGNAPTRAAHPGRHTRSTVSSSRRSHFRGADLRFANKHQLFGVQRHHPRPPLGAGPGDILARLPGRNLSPNLRVIPWRASSRATRITEVLTPASASHNTTSGKNRSGFSSSQPRISGAGASNASARPSLFPTPGQRTAVAREIRIRRPAALADMLSSRATTNRPRKSDHYGLPIHAASRHGSRHETEIRPDGTPRESS